MTRSPRWHPSPPSRVASRSHPCRPARGRRLRRQAWTSSLRWTWLLRQQQTTSSNSRQKVVPPQPAPETRPHLLLLRLRRLALAATRRVCLRTSAGMRRRQKCREDRARRTRSRAARTAGSPRLRRRMQHLSRRRCDRVSLPARTRGVAFWRGPNLVLDSLTHAPTPAGVFLLPAAVPNLTRTRVCVRLCRKSRKSGSLLPRCRLSAS